MTVLPFSPDALLNAFLTAILIYVTWKTRNNRNTKK